MCEPAVLFDLDNTLHNRDEALVNFVRFQHEVLNLFSVGIELESWSNRFVELDNGGKVWKDAVYVQLCQEFNLKLDPNNLLNDYEQTFFKFVRPNTGLSKLLEALRRSGYKIGVVTNGRAGFQRKTLTALQVDPPFDSIVVSGECGFRKPDPQVFELALNQLSASSSNSWFVGDDPNADVQGARGVGMSAILFAPNQLARLCGPDFVVNQLSQVAEIICQTPKQKL